MPAIDAREKARPVGVVLVIASTAFFALAGVFTKSITAGAWTIVCWRGLVGALIISGYVFWRGRGARRGSLHLGRGGWLLAAVSALSSIAFISAFKLTFVANVTIIYATVPFMAAGLEWLILGEKARRRTILSSLLSLLGVAIMVFGGIGGGTLLGNGLALLMTAGSAFYMVLVRMLRDTPVVWAAAVAAFMLFGAGWLVVDPLAISARDAVLTGCFGAAFAFAVILWTEGTRLITAAESGLLGGAEVPLAVLFAWLLLSETPPVTSFVGGAVVLGAVLAHAAGDFRQAETG
jgi:drug/metabolite transporter (DMT)-like permease